jgi:hypothetical protein
LCRWDLSRHGGGKRMMCALVWNGELDACSY